MGSSEGENDDWNKVLGSNFNEGSFNIPDVSGRGAIKHADNAQDFEDEDELADDEDVTIEEAQFDEEGHGGEDDELEDLIAEGLAGEHFDDRRNFNGWTEELGDEENDTFDDEQPIKEEKTSEPSSLDTVLASGSDLLNEVSETLEGNGALEIALQELEDFNNVNSDEHLLQIYYPDFKFGKILKMNSLFEPKPSILMVPRPRHSKFCIPMRVNLEVETDERRLFRSSVQVDGKQANVIKVSQDAENLYCQGGKSGQNGSMSEGLDETFVIASADWMEDDILEDEQRTSTSKKRPAGVSEDRLYTSDDEDSILEGSFEPVYKKVCLDLNDTNLLFVADHQFHNARQRAGEIMTADKSVLSRYNIANDKAYDMLKENYQSKVRATIGNLNIDHSMVAIRLQSPHYRVKLSKAQMRSHHRPSFVVKPNTVIQFSKIKQRKKKRDKGKHITQLLNETTDLTLGDSASFFLIEYSEEFPLVLSKFGMGSKLINYYRKKAVDDTYRPKLPTGETHVLSVQDRSAFLNFGFVEPGKVVPTLYNRMIRAPVFKHEPPSTDFLLIRSTGGGMGQRYFLRNIPHLFTVGQTFPVSSIPGPHSRRVTTASKNRLKMVVYRVLNQSKNHRLLVRDISSHFPDQNDMQNRQRLKEFMEYQRAGDDQGFWKVKASEPLLNEESIRAMISPEEIALLEAMQVGQQHLEDAGYGKTVDDDKEDQEGMSIEEQLAPWNITRNFINATQGKAMLQLHGEGDPSGRGEAFSFLRTSMKGGFKAMGESVNEKLDKSKFGGHSYNVAMQQKAYNEEISRIWYAQKRSLEVTNVDDLKWDEEDFNMENEQAQTPGITEVNGEDDVSLFSHNSVNAHQTKVLRITRFVKDENGTVQRKVEIVKDANVIRAYVKRRQEMEDAQLAPEEIAPTADEDLNRRKKRILEEQLARLKRNQDRRIARKAMKEGGDPGQPSSGKGIGKGKSTTRKCATCGAIGHIRTNKSCPLYSERYGSSTDATMGVNQPNVGLE